ncbi:hypothetical protein [Leptospira ilyithenensis]|uniref:Uncharacterized protein n=1 Tax=Leptospira ilyithenensis TaxID=2484901 RepID=A0A4R9LX23_9LEPT|nr:hypothetical protein [Leptospira ilyithenensis]TGN14259.1 hypothetical protein EHS11_01920 [Leptospira ilyithenensis]
MRYAKILPLFVLLWLLDCKTIVYKVPSEQINLNLVKMITAAEAAKEEEAESDSEDTKKVQLSPDPYVNVEYSENNKPFIRLELYFKDSGLNIIEEIKNGTILEHKIVVKNHKGETISAQPVNFQAYEVTETKIEKVRNKVVIGETQEKFKLSDLGKESKSYKESEPRRYSDDSPIPQALELDQKKVPSAGEFISIFLEITYVNPFLEGVCDEINLDCEKDKVIVFRHIAERNRLELESLRGSYEEGDFRKFKSLTAEEVESEKKIIKDKIFALNNSRNSSLPQEPANIKSNRSFPGSGFAPTVFKETKTTVNGSEKVGTINAFVDQTQNYDGNKYFYREWNLVSFPRFFKIQSIIKNGKSVVEEAKDKEEKKILPTLPKENSESEKTKDATSEHPESIFDKPNHTKHKKKTIYTP